MQTDRVKIPHGATTDIPLHITQATKNTYPSDREAARALPLALPVRCSHLFSHTDTARVGINKIKVDASLLMHLQSHKAHAPDRVAARV